MYESFNMHSSTVHHPGTRTPSKGIHFSWGPAGDGARPWVGWGKLLWESGGQGETNHRDFYLVKHLLLFLLCYMQDGNLQNGAGKSVEYGVSIYNLTASNYDCIYELLNLSSNTFGGGIEGNIIWSKRFSFTSDQPPTEEQRLAEAFQTQMRSFRIPCLEGRGPGGNSEASRSACIHACPVRLPLCSCCSLPVMFLTLCWETKPSFPQPRAWMCLRGEAGEEENQSGKLREQLLEYVFSLGDTNFIITLIVIIWIPFLFDKARLLSGVTVVSGA